MPTSPRRYRPPVCWQAFEIVARPALDSLDAMLDRAKMQIYLKFADWGLPCPITGHANQQTGEPGQGHGQPQAQQ